MHFRELEEKKQSTPPAAAVVPDFSTYPPAQSDSYLTK
ncbi:hypothetical protein BN2497_14111 [Janthinobacterium sp. CG23_2]|nr:hypothetical protein BN2497_14111 [Janthinobacterium sp. CG23_2]CUU33453.1 hypothetical protein BN3177_14111 [Janthinobacterium sp. CG23_2]